MQLMVSKIKAHSWFGSEPDFLTLSTDSVQRIADLVISHGSLLNGRQCAGLSSKLVTAIQNIKVLASHGLSASTNPFKLGLKRFYRISEKARLLIINCSHERWCEASVVQVQNEEEFREILLEVGLCYNVIYEQAKAVNEAIAYIQDLRETSMFLPASESDVLEDEKTLQNRLEDLAKRPSSSSDGNHVLANYLLRGKMKCICERCTCENMDMSGNKGPLEHGSKASVSCKTEWMGIPCAWKKFQNELVDDSAFCKEAAILARLKHPNIVRFYCSFNDRVEGKYFIGMEPMELSLLQLIEDRKKAGEPFPFYVTLDIIVQIARGMCYLHDLGIAHCDLKPQNVMIDKLIALNDNFCVKLVNCTTSMKLFDSNSIPVDSIGTATYRAPEVFGKAQHGPDSAGEDEADWLKADVYSFGMTCAHILSLDEPVQGALEESIITVRRPEISTDNFGNFVTLLKECWSIYPESRPDFIYICSKLEEVRQDLLTVQLHDEFVASYKHVERMVKESSEFRLNSYHHKLFKWMFEIHRLPDQFCHCSIFSSAVESYFLNLSMDSVQGVANLVRNGNLLNGRQCEDMSSKLVKTVKNIEELVSHLPQFRTSVHPFRPALENLYRISEKAKLLVINCSDEKWCEASVFQIQNEEAFREILVELGLCYNVIYEKAKSTCKACISEILDLRRTPTFFPAPKTEVLKDEQILQKRLEDLVKSPHLSNDRDRWLARYLVGRMKCISQECKGKDLVMSAILKTIEPKGTWKVKDFLGSGSGAAAVCKTKWMGIGCARKEFSNDVEEAFFKESAILVRLNHPNIIKFFCCSKNEKCYLGMELMEMSLDRIIKDRKKTGDTFPLHVALDIIMQIARGMCHLHDLGTAHRDLKPLNVVANKITIPCLVDSFCVKLVDFGMSTTKMNLSKSHTMSVDGVGTTLYRAPEVYPKKQRAHTILAPKSNEKANWSKADVYSFSVTCAHILSLKEPFQGMDTRASTLYRMILGGLRPELPMNCPEKLVVLLEECWDLNPWSRPGFLNICTRLEEVKQDLLSRPSTLHQDLPPTRSDCMSYSYIERMLKNCSESRRVLPENLRSPENLIDEDVKESKYLEPVPDQPQMAKREMQTIKEINVAVELSTLPITARMPSTVDIPSTSGNLTSLTTLDLGGCEGLKELPMALSNLTSLTSIYLTGCKGLKEIPEALGFLTSLTTLDLGGCEGLKEIPEALRFLTSLTILNLNGCKGLMEIPWTLGYLTSLTTLDLGGCEGLKEIPEALRFLTSLTILNLNGCKGLMEIPWVLRFLTSLTILNLNGCKGLMEIPWALRFLTSLTTLDLGGCEGLKELPMALSNLTSLTSIYLTGCKGLKEIPEALGLLTSLTTLDLGGCEGLKEIPEALRFLTSLTILNLNGCKGLMEIPWTLGYLTSLTTLDLGGCEGLKEIPEALRFLTSLTILNLNGCKGLMEIPWVLRFLTSLTILNLNGCKGLMEIPWALRFLTSLTTLDLGGCEGLQEILEAFRFLTSLTILNLNGCKGLMEIPWALRFLTSLTTLDLGGCEGLKEIPEALRFLTSLTILNLNGCKGLMEIPWALRFLTSLTTLDLGGCEGLKEIPEALRFLTSLTILNLNGCKSLMEIPWVLRFLTSLTILNLNGCKGLMEIPWALRFLTSLTTLDLGGCEGLKEIPETMGNLTSLNILNLNGCKGLMEIPETMGNLTSLNILNLNGCKGLMEIPWTLGYLTSLMTLDLGGCGGLKEIPETMGNLTSLNILNLNGCKGLMEIPWTLGYLTSLTTLDLGGCEGLKEIPETIGNLTSLTILNLIGCKGLKKILEASDNLTSLTTLDFEGDIGRVG